MADIKLGNVPVSVLNDTDNIIFAEGEAIRKESYLSMKQDILGTETMTTTATSVKGAINELDGDISGINTQLLEKANDTDATRTTTSKTVTGAINELNTNKITKGSPIEYALPFVNSIVNNGSYKNSYYRNGSNEVTVIASFKRSGTSDDIPNGLKICTLPINYRPINTIWSIAQIITVSGLVFGNATISLNGDVFVFLPTNVPYELATFSITFLGGN